MQTHRHTHISRNWDHNHHHYRFQRQHKSSAPFEDVEIPRPPMWLWRLVTYGAGIVGLYFWFSY